MINKDTLYEKALMESVPFFKWYQWIEATINKEVLSKIIKEKSTNTTTTAKKVIQALKTGPAASEPTPAKK
jgi:hypothetical protein